MSRYKFPDLLRQAIWQVHNCRCAYCGEPIRFNDLEVDHVIPHDYLDKPTDLAKLRQDYNLDSDFSIESFRNYLPSCGTCNNRKSNGLLPGTPIYLHLAGVKAPDVEKYYKRLEKDNNAQRVKTLLKVQLKQGTITVQEIKDYLDLVIENAEEGPNNPVIVCFGLSIYDVLDDPDAHQDLPHWALCDWLESELQRELASKLQCQFQRTEASLRNGESLSVRYAFWDLDLDTLNKLDYKWWEILEVALHTSIYSDFTLGS